MRNASDYAEEVQLLLDAADRRPGAPPIPYAEQANLLACAQVLATLAQASATEAAYELQLWAQSHPSVIELQRTDRSGSVLSSPTTRPRDERRSRKFPRLTVGLRRLAILDGKWVSVSADLDDARWDRHYPVAS